MITYFPCVEFIEAIKTINELMEADRNELYRLTEITNMERSKPVENFLDSLAQAGEIDRNNTSRCIHCKQPFTDKNVFTPDGWAEVEISRCCEKCFDEMFGE